MFLSLTNSEFDSTNPPSHFQVRALHGLLPCRRQAQCETGRASEHAPVSAKTLAMALGELLRHSQSRSRRSPRNSAAMPSRPGPSPPSTSASTPKRPLAGPSLTSTTMSLANLNRIVVESRDNRLTIFRNFQAVKISQCLPRRNIRNARSSHKD